MLAGSLHLGRPSLNDGVTKAYENFRGDGRESQDAEREGKIWTVGSGQWTKWAWPNEELTGLQGQKGNPNLGHEQADRKAAVSILSF
jgi:hypothetical protein